MRRIFSIWLLAALAPLLLSCSDDSTTTTANYLDGSVRFSIPRFVAAGDEIPVRPSGISHPDGEAFGYYWTVGTLHTHRDTIQTLLGTMSPYASDIFEVPDTIGTFSLSVTAFANNYYPSSGSADFTILHPTLSITGASYMDIDGGEMLTDARDGLRYPVMQAAGLRWMCRNLAWEGAGAIYDECPATVPVFGRYYNWEEAMTACPEGWRLPTEFEWAALVEAASGETGLLEDGTFPAGAGSLMGKASLNGDLMWEYWPEVPVTDAVGFCALPFGYGNLSTYEKDRFTGLANYAAFWTATEVDASQARYRYLNVHRPEVFAGKADKRTFAASVRCVR